MKKSDKQRERLKSSKSTRKEFEKKWNKSHRQSGPLLHDKLEDQYHQNVEIPELKRKK